MYIESESGAKKNTKIKKEYSCHTIIILFQKELIIFVNKMYARHTGSFFRARMWSSGSARMNNSNFRLLTKLCSVDMTVFETVIHPNVDNWIQSLA